MKKTSLVLALIVAVLVSSTSALAQAPLPKVRLDGLPMLALAAENLPAERGARDDLPTSKELQRGRLFSAAGAGLLAASAITFAAFGRKQFCQPYEGNAQYLTSPFVIASALASAGLSFTIAGAHRIQRSDGSRDSAWKRWIAPLLLGAGVAATAVTAGAVGPYTEGMRAGCFNS